MHTYSSVSFIQLYFLRKLAYQFSGRKIIFSYAEDHWIFCSFMSLYAFLYKNYLNQSNTVSNLFLEILFRIINASKIIQISSRKEIREILKSKRFISIKNF